MKLKTKKNMQVLKKVGKSILYLLGFVFIFAILLFIYVNLPVKEKNKKAEIGVTFSYRYAQDIGLDWRQAYQAMLDDLKIKNIRIPAYWDSIEKEDGQYDFSDLDWQLEKAQQANANVVLAMGKKEPRWPECYVPSWVGTDPDTVKQKLLAFEKVVINRYKDTHPEIVHWQIENEPFLDFGTCGTVPTDLLDAEISHAKNLDPSRPIIVTDSGELSSWIPAASRADIFGTTMYREVYTKKWGHWKYPIGPNFFKLKQLLIKWFANQDNAIVIELQGEPWVEGWTTSAPVQTQLESMNASILLDNVSFAKKTGMKEIYIWGVEWWYWMKVEQNNSTLWETAKSFR